MIRVLFVDDDSNVLNGLRRMLRPMSGQWEMVFLGNADDALAHFDRTHVDVLVTDLHMPGTDGMQLLRRVRKDDRYASVAIVVLTGAGCESIAVKALKSGAQDYLTKGSLTIDQLKNAVESAIADVSAAQQQAAQTDQAIRMSKRLAEANLCLAEMSRFDPLTKLFNRGAWEETASLEQEQFGSEEQGFSIIMVDIDHFKKLNDTLGHQAGDECLRRVARTIREGTRGTDIVGRFGGEEFIVLAPGTDHATAMILAERIRGAVWNLEIAHPSSPTASRVTVSVGAANSGELTWPEVVPLADRALYAAKNGGRNQIRHYDDVKHLEPVAGSAQ